MVSLSPEIAAAVSNASVAERLPDCSRDLLDSAGACSPGCNSHPIVWPTGTTAPSRALTALRIPSPGDSISTTALSVSIARSVSPFATRSPTCLRHATTFPVSCAISSAGITTLIAMRWIVLRNVGRSVQGRRRGASDFRLQDLRRRNHFDHFAVRRRLELAHCGQPAFHGHVLRAGDEELFGRKPRDDFVARLRHHDLFLDARGAPAVLGRPERFEREDHSRLDLVRM